MKITLKKTMMAVFCAAMLGLSSNALAQQEQVIIEGVFNADGLNPGDVYTDGAFAADRTYDNALIASFQTSLVSIDHEGDTDPWIVAPGNTGITSQGDFFPGTLDYPGRLRLDFNLGNAVVGRTYTITKVEITVSGITAGTSTFRCTAGYKLANGTNVLDNFNSGADLTNGTHSVNISENLTFTDAASPLTAGMHFRICPADASAGVASTGGVIESFKVYATVTGDAPTAINDAELASALKVYPVPATDEITVTSDDVISTLQIVNLVGNVDKQVNASGNTAIVDISDLESGIYLVKVIGVTGIVKTSKFIKQ